MSGPEPKRRPRAAQENGGDRPAPAWLAGGWTSYVFSAALLLAMFYFYIGTIDGFAIAFTAFVLIVAAGAEYLPRASADATSAEGRSTIPPPRWQGCLGVVWLLSFPFAPLFCWFLFQTVEITSANWHALLGLRVALCIVMPLVTMLPLLRYLKRGYVALQLAVLAIGTGFPIITALGAARDLITGPVWQAVVIDQVGITLHMSRGHGDALAENEIVLADGRTLRRAREVPLQVGPARLLVLTGTDRIIAARGPAAS